MAGIGHNSGRTFEAGFAWRKHVWTRARRDLLPVLPVEVVRKRVKRAQELGLPYRTYAGLRASNGHDLVGFLFSSNALRVLRAQQDLPQDRQEKLAALRATRRIGVAHKPVTAAQLAAMAALDAGVAAPSFALSWSDTRAALAAIFAAQNTPADRFVMIGDTGVEQSWVATARMAGYLDAAGFFDARSG